MHYLRVPHGAQAAGRIVQRCLPLLVACLPRLVPAADGHIIVLIWFFNITLPLGHVLHAYARRDYCWTSARTKSALPIMSLRVLTCSV